MNFLSRDQRNLIFSILNNPYFTERVKYLLEFFDKSRDTKVRGNANALLAMQFEAANFETKLWKVMAEQRKAIKTLKREVHLTDSEQIELRKMQEGFESHRQLDRIIRTILDGVAWRSLGYNRFFITSAARSTASGSFSLDLASSKRLFNWAYGIQKAHKGVVIINDLTRFLRIGDLTEVYDDTAVIHELKRDGRRIINFKTLEHKKGRKISNQTRKMLELQSIAFKRKITMLDGSELQQWLCSTPLQTHFLAVELLLESSSSQVVVRKVLEPFFQFSVINLEKAYLRPEKIRRYLKAFRYSIWKTPWQLSFTNYDHFFYDQLGNFFRNQIPFSNYPFSSEICMKLMSGQILIECTINYEILSDELRKRNWKTKLINPVMPADQDEKVKHIFDNQTFILSDLGDTDGLIEIQRGPFTMVIPANWVSMMSMEFMTFETFCRMLEEIYQHAASIQAPLTIFPEFSNATQVWN